MAYWQLMLGSCREFTERSVFEDGKKAIVFVAQGTSCRNKKSSQGGQLRIVAFLPDGLLYL